MDAADAPVEERQQIKNAQDGHETEVDLSHQLPFIDGRETCPIVKVLDIDVLLVVHGASGGGWRAID